MYYLPAKLKIAVFDNPCCLTLHIQGTPANILIHLILRKLAYSHCTTFLPLRPIEWVYLHSNFRGGLRKRMHFETECEMDD